MEEEQLGSRGEELQSLMDLGSSVIRSERGNLYVLTIVGQIEGHQLLPSDTKATKYEHILPLLAGIEGNEGIHGLLLLLNNGGGDVEAGLAIAEMVASMSKPTVSLVLGGSHSIGVPLAVSARRSLIAPSAAMTIHPVRMSGMVVGVPQTFTYFQRIQDRIVRFILSNSRIGEEEFTRLMLQTGELMGDVGTVIHGEEAVALGLIDALGGLSDAMAYLYGEIEKDRKQKG